MDAIIKELNSRKNEIQNEVDEFFKKNMKITDWDVPEADDREAAKVLFTIIQEKLNSIQSDIESGQYDYY